MADELFSNAIPISTAAQDALAKNRKLVTVVEDPPQEDATSEQIAEAMRAGEKSTPEALHALRSFQSREGWKKRKARDRHDVGENDDGKMLTKAEAIQLARLIARYPVLRKVL